jgi:very-short-patch-repair endonuclease
LYRNAMNRLSKARTLEEQRYYGGKKKEQVDRAELEMMIREARRQLDILCGVDTKFEESDFYPYRYLASEGFLPGYNFPSLPVRAYINSGDEGDYIGRPRFVAISEYGPQNVIYHEGSKYQINRVYLPPQEPEQRFLAVKICDVCGYIHHGDSITVDLCMNCNTELTGANSKYLEGLLDMPTVGTRRRERITCDEEDRLRQGFELTAQFQYAKKKDGTLAQQRADTINPDKEAILNLSFAPAATIWRINHRWRRSEQMGYNLELPAGNWVGRNSNDEEQGQSRQGGIIRSNVRLFVQNTANAILLHPTDEELYRSDPFLATLQYAISRGIQVVFQVEERELSSERIGEGKFRSVLLWESAEGGLGILRRLVDESDKMAEVAYAALQLLHFDPETGEDLHPPKGDEGCAKACYDCLLSYFNQRDHLLLIRHLVKEYLFQLIQGFTQRGGGQRNFSEHYKWLRELTDSRSDLERKLLDYLYNENLKLPDAAQHRILNPSTVADFYYHPNVCVYCDGSVHDTPQQRSLDENIRKKLGENGYRVIVIRYDKDLQEQVNQHKEIFT